MVNYTKKQMREYMRERRFSNDLAKAALEHDEYKPIFMIVDGKLVYIDMWNTKSKTLVTGFSLSQSIAAAGY